MSYIDQDELYIKLDHNQTQVYKLVDSIHPGGVYTIAMAGAQTPVYSSISISGTSYEARVWGFRDADYENGLPIMTEYDFDNVPAGNSIKVATIPGHFQGYHTELKVVEDLNSMTAYNYRVNGAIPASFVKIAAQVQSVTPLPAGKIDAVTSGDFTTTGATWQFYARNNQSFTWTMYGTNTMTSIRLPNLSPNMLQTFPTLALDSLNFYNLELTKYHGLASYQDFLGTLFNPASPRTQNKLNASTLVYGQSK